MPDRAMTRLSRRTLVTAASVFAATAALDQSSLANEDPSPSPEASPSSTPELLLRMEPIGGTQPPELQLIAPPEFSLFDDGTIFRLGPMIAIFPPPALPNVTRMRVSPAAVRAIMDEARKAGLDQPLRVPDETMPDSIPVHRFLYNDGDELVESLVLGLMIDAVQAPDWGEEALEQHQALRTFASYLWNIPFNLPAEDVLEQEMPIDPDRLQVLSFEASPEISLASGVPNLEQPPLEWPLDAPLADLSTSFEPAAGSSLPALGCIELSGSDAQAVVETSRQGDLLSPWIDNETMFGVLLKPLLPDQRGCQAPDR